MAYDDGFGSNYPRRDEPGVREVPAKVVVEVIMTPAEYESIRHNASWDGKTVAAYLRDHALGRTRRGC